MRTVLGFLMLLASLAAAQDFDVVIDNGRVMDPESGLDAVRHIGIVDGRIAAVSEAQLEGRGRDRIDASGLVVAPGFIDLRPRAWARPSPPKPTPIRQARL